MTNENQTSKESMDSGLMESNFGEKTWERLTEITGKFSDSNSVWDTGLPGSRVPDAKVPDTPLPLANTHELSSFLSSIKPLNLEDNPLESSSFSSSQSFEMTDLGVTSDLADILLQHGEFPASPVSPEDCETTPSTASPSTVLSVEGRKNPESLFDSDGFKKEPSAESFSTLGQEYSSGTSQLDSDHESDKSFSEDQEFPKREEPQYISLGPGQSSLSIKKNNHLQQRHHPYPKPPPPPTPTPTPSLTPTPTSSPTPSPTPLLTPAPTPAPTPLPTPSPTSSPTSSPEDEPFSAPPAPPKYVRSEADPSQLPVSPRLQLLRTVAVDDTSRAFRSHPLFPLLRDLVVTDMHYSATSLPIASLLSRLPATTRELIEAFYMRNDSRHPRDSSPKDPASKGHTRNDPVPRDADGFLDYGAEAATSPAVDAVVLDALQYAHERLMAKMDAHQSSLMCMDPWEAVERQAAAQRAYTERRSSKRPSGTPAQEIGATYTSRPGSSEYCGHGASTTSSTGTFTINACVPGGPLLSTLASRSTTRSSSAFTSAPLVTFSKRSQPQPHTQPQAQPQPRRRRISPLIRSTPKPLLPPLSSITSTTPPETSSSADDFNYDSDYDHDLTTAPAWRAERTAASERSSSAALQKPQKEKVSKKAMKILTTWLTENSNYPFPTDAQKDVLALQTGLQKRHINNWFSNVRRKRMLKLRLGAAATGL